MLPFSTHRRGGTSPHSGNQKNAEDNCQIFFQLGTTAQGGGTSVFAPKTPSSARPTRSALRSLAGLYRHSSSHHTHCDCPSAIIHRSAEVAALREHADVSMQVVQADSIPSLFARYLCSHGVLSHLIDAIWFPLLCWALALIEHGQLHTCQSAPGVPTETLPAKGRRERENES